MVSNSIDLSRLQALQDGSRLGLIDLSEYSTPNYLYKKEKKGVFLCSSGVCNLKCSYCITNRPCVNHNLHKDDFTSIFKYFGENICFVFSGMGDFFCGYSKKEELLRFLLQQDVRISYLDINGVDIKELASPGLEGKGKIDMINISYHFGSMKELKLINRWMDSIKKIHENQYHYEMKMVASPLEREIWEEAILFYHQEIQSLTGQKLIICPDTLFNLELQYDELTRIAESYKDVVDLYDRDRIFRGRRLPSMDTQPCPAGSRFFRIFNNGDLVPCELLGSYNIKLGNLKKKDLVTFDREINCPYTGFCDCGWSAHLGVRVSKGPVDRYLSERNRIYRKLKTLPLSPETNNIRMSIDRFEEDAKTFKLEGWAFINDGIYSEHTDTYIVLKSDHETHLLLPDKRIRPDVADHFHSSGLYNSGFSLCITKNGFESGQYRLGLFIKRDGRDALQYTDKTITIS